MAISVVLQHSTDFYLKSFAQQYPIRCFFRVASYYGVFGFFLLSSFLLTYRLFGDLTKSNSTSQSISLIVIKYFIRRFFRIYVPFVIYCTMVKFVLPSDVEPHPAYKLESWTSLVTLTYNWSGFFWTIAPEIKYYFFIPIFSLLVFKAKKFSILLLIIISIVTCICDVNYVFQFRGHTALTSKFTVFFKGSIMAIFYYKIENLEVFLRVRQSLNLNYIPAICLSIFGFKLLTEASKEQGIPTTNYASIIFFSNCWTMFLFSMLLLSPNRFADIFKSRLLQQIGKFSFGFYLLHPFSIYLTVNHLSKLLPIDNDFSGLFWILTLLYWLSKCFYYLVEFPLIKVTDYCCKRISSKEYFLQKNVLEI